MDQDSKEKTLEKLTRAENILIAASPKSGFDGLAASLAVYLSCQKLGKKTSVYGLSPTIEDARRLYGVDKVGKFDQSQNLMIVIEDAVNSVDKVSYFLEQDKLKILVHSLPGSNGVSGDQISFEKSSTRSDLIFTLGFNSRDEMNKEVLHEQYIDANVWIVAITKDNLNQNFAHANVFNPQATGLSEVAAQLLQDLAMPIDEDISYNLYSGIAYATGNFSPSKTTPSTFQIASWLIKFGAGKASFATGTQEINKKIGFIGPSSNLHLSPMDQVVYKANLTSPFETTPIDKIEEEKMPEPEEDWFKPPKIYKGAKSFDKKY